MRTLRWPLRVYISAVIATAVLAFLVASIKPEPAIADHLTLALVLFAAAAIAQIRPIHVSTKMKLTVSDVATFAGSVLVGPLLAMAVAAGSMLVGSFFHSKQPTWYNRLFNVSVGSLGTGAAAATYAFLAVSGASVAQNPIAVVVAAVVMYLVQTALVDVVVALQLRRDPVATWWPLHRREVVQSAALYALGGLAALSLGVSVWTSVLFVVPVLLVFATMRESARLRQQTRQAIYELADLVDQRDPYTHGHSQRVAQYAERLARRLKLSPTQIDLIREAARMHDVGKIRTPDDVLNKPGPLDVRELVEMHAHAEDGAKLLARLPDFWEGAALVRAHHERHDGTGYPRGLAGKEIPLEAYVIAVADAYDAMATDRPYRNALTWPQIVSEYHRGRGTQWTTEVVDAFVAMMESERETRVAAQVAQTA
jgi:putative nucleotidyltransferase with HDIG domain